MSSERTRRARRAIALLLLAAPITGCASERGPIFAPVSPALRWPAPPETPRIEYVGALRGEADLARGRSLGEALFGAAEPRALVSPYGVATDGGDRLFVVDKDERVVSVFDLAARRFDRWSGGDPGFISPLGVAWDARNGRLLVADGEAGHVAVLDGRGRPRAALGGAALVRPSGVAVDGATGRIAVADPGAHAVVIFETDGRLVRRLGPRGIEPGQFNFPTNVAFGRDGALYVADTLNFRIQVFDAAFAPLRVMGTQGDTPGSFSQPKGLALDRDDHLYVVDAHFEAVQIFDTAGQLLLTFGREGRGPGEFWLPAAIHIDGTDRIWIADTYNQRVQVFRYLAEGAVEMDVATGEVE